MRIAPPPAPTERVGILGQKGKIMSSIYESSVTLDAEVQSANPQFWQQAKSVADWLAENAEDFAWTYKGSTAVRRLIHHIDQSEAETIVHRLPATLPVRPLSLIHI